MRQGGAQTGARLGLRTSPHLHGRRDTRRLMFDVLLALVPAALGAVYFFGLSAALLLATCSLVCGATEIAYRRARGRVPTGEPSAWLTGFLLGLTLPPACPLWMAALGSLAAILAGKLFFGGLGANVFNPALVGRVFLQSAFPAAMTTWSAPFAADRFARTYSSTFAWPFFAPRYDQVDVLSGATPLAAIKWDGVFPPLRELILGTHAGSLGETSAALLLAGGLFLVVRRALDWRIPLAIFVAAGTLGGALALVDPARYPDPLRLLASGGLMLGAWFMATDPVTSPLTTAGVYVFGALIGALVVIIRSWGGLPEGVMYAILLANAVSPLIDRLTQSRVYGVAKRTMFGS